MRARVAMNEQPVDLPKRPVTKLAGPYGHPFHPIFVTIPIGTWIGSFVFDLVSRSSDTPETFATASYWLLAIGILGALVAAVFGLMDLLAIPRGTPVFRTAITHMTLNLAIVGTFAVSWVVRVTNDYTVVPIGLVALSAVALGVLTISGWLGGRMSYRWGVRVAEESEQIEGYRAA